MSIILDGLRQQKVLSGPELDSAQEEFLNLDFKGREECWVGLHDFFVKAPLAADRKFWYTYFRWYTHLTWAALSQRDEEMVSSVAFPRQVVMAILLEFDPITELMDYLNGKGFDEESMASFYTKLRDGVLKTGAIVGVAKGREVTGADLIKELTLINQTKDNLRLAEFTSRLGDVLLPKTDDVLLKYIPINRNDAAAAYLNLISFFVGVVPETIWAMVRTAFHPENYDTAVVPETGTSASQTSPANSQSGKSVNRTVSDMPLTYPAQTMKPSTIGEVPQPKKAAPSIALPPKKEVALPSSSAPARPQSSSRPTNKEIRSMVDALFPPQEGTEEERLPKVLNLLETLAVRYGDESVRDLYFFNSERGRFEWLA